MAANGQSFPFLQSFDKARGDLDAELDPPGVKRDLARDFPSERDRSAQ